MAVTPGPSRRSTARRAAVVVAALAALATLAAIVLAGLLWSEHRREVALPAPTGSYAVGRAHAYWTDAGRTGALAADSGAERVLAVWAWYPADSTAGAPPVEYFPSAWRAAAARYAGLLRSTFILHDPAGVRAHALESPPAAPTGTEFPVIVLRPALGAFSLDYTTIAEDLASRGAVVIAADAPYGAPAIPMPDGSVAIRTESGSPGDGAQFDRLLAISVADTKSLLDRLEQGGAATLHPTLAGRLDLARVGVVGHAFGGTTALQFCHEDARCRVGADMDGVPRGTVAREGIAQPFIFLASDRNGAWRDGGCAACDQIVATAKVIAGQHRILALASVDSSGFSDRALTPGPLARRLTSHAGAGTAADARAALVAIGGHLRDFIGPVLAAPAGGR